MLTIQSSCSYTVLQVPALDQCWRQDVGLQGPSELVCQVQSSYAQEQQSNSGQCSSSHPFYQDCSEASSGISCYFSSVQYSLWVILEKGSKNKVLKRMTVIVTWFHSYKALNPPAIHSLTEYKTIRIGLKIFENSCLYKQLFYLQKISFWSKYCTYDHKFLLFMWLKINKQITIEKLQQAFLLNFLKIQKWLLGGTFQTYVLKSVFSETTKMSQSLCLFVIVRFRTFLILCQSELDEMLQECVLHFFFMLKLTKDDQKISKSGI